MALRPTCDVYGTAKGVKPFMILVVELDPGETGAESADEIAEEQAEDHATAMRMLEDVGKPLGPPLYADLCPQAFKRLCGKIGTGTTSPKPKKKPEEAPGDAALGK